jgi:Variant SH3 domain
MSRILDILEVRFLFPWWLTIVPLLTCVDAHRIYGGTAHDNRIAGIDEYNKPVISTTATPTPVISFPTTTPTPSASSAASNADAASGSSKGISGGGIAAIVTILVIAFLGVVLFFVRKMYIRKRELKRGTWGAGAFAKHTEFLPEQGEKSYDNASGFMPGAGNSPSSPFASSAFGHQRTIAPPPMSYNNNFSPLSTAPPSLSPGMGAAVGMERASAEPTPTDAFIKCTFIPSLPDELSISTGETVRVVAEYDDGWAMCANARGEQGMVPLECLDQTRGRGSVGDIQQFQGQSDWRGSKRVSSLQPARY